MGFDVAEYSKKRKEEEQKKYRLSAEDETSGFDVAEYSKSRNASSVLENLQKKLKTWSEQSNNLVNNYNSRYYDSEGNYIDKYRSDYNDWLNNVSQNRSNLLNEATEMLRILGEYENFIRNDSFSEIQDVIKANTSTLSKIYDSALSEQKHLSQFKTEDDYNWWYNAYNYDLDTGLERIQSYGGKENDDALSKEKTSFANAVALKSSDMTSEDVKKYLDYFGEDAIAYTGSDGKNITWKSLYSTKKQAEEFDTLYTTLSAKDDWEKNSQYIPTTDSKYNSLKALFDGDADWDYEKINGKAISASIDGDSTSKKYLYQFLTEEEKQIFNYMYHTSPLGGEVAYDWLKSMRGQLEQRQLTTAQENAKILANADPTGILPTALSIADNVIAAPVEEVADYLKLLFEGENSPNTSAAISSTLRGTVMENTDWKVGDYDVHDFLYSTGTSALDSLGAGALWGKAGGFVLGLSASAQERNDALNRGLSAEKAALSGFAAGLFEGLFESVSLGQLSKFQANNLPGLKNFVADLAKVSGVNALEETGTEVANIVYDRVVNGDFSNYATKIRQYMQYEGLSESEAKKKVATEEALQVVEAGASGALMGLGFGVGGKAMNAVADTKVGKSTVKNGKVSNIVELGKTYSPDTVAYKLANKITDKSSAYDIGSLVRSIGIERSSQNIADIQKTLENRGIAPESAKKIAKWLNKAADGDVFTKKERNDLLYSEDIGEAFKDLFLNENSPILQRNQAVNKLHGIESSMGIDRKTLEESQTPEAIGKTITQRLAQKATIGEELRRGADSRRGLSSEQISEIDAFAAKARTTIPESNYKDVGQDASYKPSSAKIAKTEGKVSDTGKTFVKSTGEEVSIKKISSIDAKNKTMKLELSNGTIVDSNDVSYGDENQAVLYESALLMGYDAHTANAIVNGYTASSPTSVSDYLIGTNEAFNYGWGHISEKARGGTGYNKLTQAERAYAVKLGEDARAADDTAREAKVSQKQTSATKKKAKGGYGARLSVDKKSVTDRAAKSVKALDAVAKALKLNMIIADLGGNSYGFYRKSTNELVVDVNAGGNGKNTLLFTASHELIHYIRNWSPKKFTVLADFLMEQYAAKGENIDALIRAEIDKAYKATRGKHEMSYDEAYEEVVAQAMQRFLTDSNFIERLASLEKKDANLAKRLISKLKEILNSIRAAYQGMDTRDRASQAVKEIGEAIDELYAKMEEGLIAASEASQSIGSRNLEEFSEAKTTDGEDLFQYKAMEADEEAYRQMLKKHGIMSEQDINKLFSTIDKALVIIKNNLEVLDYAWEADIDDRSFSPVKPNSDNLYKVSLDFSTLCRKRILQQVIQTQLQDALNKPLSREESIAIRDELMKIQEEGRQIEIACALCYVESARMKSPAQIKKFLKNREAVIKEFLASKSGGDIKQKIKQAEADARERLGAGDASLKSMPKKVADQIRAAKKEAKKAYTPTAEEQKLIDAASSMAVTDFTSPEGLENLAKNYPVLFDAYTSYVRNATKSKGIEKDTWWRAGDSNSIGDTLIANMNRENGLRSQSWSDFQVIHLLDYIAATIELSTRNAKEQAYSKVPDYIDLMGNTGVMLNMSLIPTAQFNGKLEYDSVEGMAYKKALELRDKYHATAGTICIGISNEQIKMLLDDSTIDYVIPYHKSGMAAHIRKLMHIPTWSEYEDYQSEKDLSRDEAVKQAKKYGVTLLSESDPNYHKHTDFSEWFDIEEARQIAKQENAFHTDAKLQKKYDAMYGGYMAMKTAADNYLKLCAERGLSPKFSYENANFTTEANYWKLLIDRKMVDNVTGEIIEQQAIKPIFEEGEVLRILNDELERYPNIKADQDYATRTVVEKFLSGKMNDRLDPDTIAAIMQKPVDNITATNIVASEDDVKAQYADKSVSGRYSYEELTSKPDMKLTTISNNVPNNRADVISQAKKNATKLGKFDSQTGSVSVRVDDVDADIILGRDGLKHSLDRRFNVNAPVVLKAGEILSNSIRINELTSQKPEANESYVLIGAARNSSNELYIVRSVVNSFSNELTSIDVLYAINAKKEPAALLPLSTGKPALGTDSTISIANLLDYVNQYFPDILPESVLKHYGYDARPEGDLGEDALYQYADTETDLAPTFYSQMGKVVEGVKQEKLAANSVVNMLRGKGVKAEEIRWSGIVPFLEGKKSVTKQELLDFINGSMLQIGEQMSSNDIDLRYDSNTYSYSLYDRDGNVINKYTYNDFIGGYVSEKDDEIYTYSTDIEDAVREEYGELSSPRWADYKLDGGENYREIVFTLPNSSYRNQMMRVHWGDDAEGVLAHARIQDFDVDGKKMLFIEEIQSDYHNEGHQSGYNNSETDAKIDELKAVAEEKFFALEDYSTEMTGNAGEWETIEKTEKGAKLLREYREAQDAHDSAMNEYVKRIPDAPFKETYHEYVLKRLLRMAAEEGYDSIGWTTADIQSKRWSEDYAEGYRIEYDQDIPKFLRKHGRQWGAKVGNTNLPNGTEVWSMDITDSMKNSVLHEGQEMYQYIDEDAIDNRTLLAKSLEGAAKTDIEKQKLKEYQSKIDLINLEEKKLRELREQIKEISFSKGTRDTKKLKDLQFEANQAANRINVYDKQLLRLESTKPIANVLAREKELAKKRQRQKDMQLLADYREKSKATVKELLERNQESRKKAIDGREKTFMRHKIKGIVNELNQLILKGTKDKHVMIGLQKAVASALDAVNMDTVNAEERVAKYDALIAKAKDPDVIASLTETRDRIAEQGDKMSDRLTALKNAYGEIKNSNDPLIANSHDEVIENKIESVVNSVGNTPLRDMTLEQLEDVYDMYKMVLTTIRNSNKAFKMDKTKTIAILGNNIMGEVHSIAGEKQYTLKVLEGLKSFGWSSLKPTQAFEAIGSGTFKKVFENVRAGEDTWAVDVNEAREYYREKSGKYGYDSWDFDRRYEFTSKGGKKFSLSLEQIMSLYAYSKRKQADLHLEQGGFVFDEAIEVVEKKKGIPFKYKVNTANAYSISKEELVNIIGTLSDRQRFFVDEMQAYLSDVMGAKGNEVSLEMYGVKLFKEQFYFPLKSAKQFMFEQNEVAGEVKIKNSGFSKETVAKANNPIILSNFMDVWSKHVNDMSMYHAFVLPLEDFNRVFNYKTPTSDKYNPESVKSYLQNAYGTQPVAYIKQLITDLNGGARSDASAGYVNKGIALFKKGAVFASASVVIQQPSAIARAFAYINPKYFVTAKLDLTKHSRDWEECKQHAPVARIKEMGYFDTNVGPQTTEWITAKEYKGFKEKLKGLKDSNYRDELLSKAPAIADEIAWTHIWNAVKKEIASTTNLKVGSEEFLKRAGERFTEVVVNTQVYDSVLTRSGLMRSKDTGVKMATAFMAEPTTSLNMIVNAFVQAKRGNKKLARNIAGGVASSIILNSILVSLVYAARDDDEDETYVEKYLGSMISELVDGFNPITYIPFAKDIWSIAQGYDVERSDMSVYSKLWESFEELFDENKSVKEKVNDFSGSVATIFGLPLKNIMRDINALMNLATNDLGISDTTKAGLGHSISDALRNSIPLLGRFYEEDTKAKKLYDAILGGDATEIERAKSGFKNEDAINTALRTALRENDPRIKEAAQARIDGDISKYKSIVKDIASEGHFSQDLVVKAINSEINAINKEADDANESSDDEEESKATSIYKASDINAALENGDTSAALEVINDLVKVKTENYIAEGEKKKDAEKKAKSSVKGSVTSYWKPLYLAAYKAKNSSEMARIRKLLKSTKLYDNVVETCQDWVKQSK